MTGSVFFLWVSWEGTRNRCATLCGVGGLTSALLSMSIPKNKTIKRCESLGGLMVKTLSCKLKDSGWISVSGSFFYLIFFSKAAYYNVPLKKSLQQRGYEI